MHLFNDLLRIFDRKDLLNDEVKLLLRVFSEDRTMRKCLKFSLRSVFKVFSVEVEGSDEEEPSEELENNNITTEKSKKHFLHFFKNRLHLTNLILNLNFNLSTILSFSFAAAVVHFFVTDIKIV